MSGDLEAANKSALCWEEITSYIIDEWYLLFFAKFRSQRVNNKSVMTESSF